MECDSHLQNVQDTLAYEESPHERSFDAPLDAPIIPFLAQNFFTTTSRTTWPPMSTSKEKGIRDHDSSAQTVPQHQKTTFSITFCDADRKQRGPPTRREGGKGEPPTSET